MSNAGLIAAACGQLDTLIQGSGSQGNLSAKLGNGIAMEKVYQKGTTKPAKVLSDGLYSYCSGVQV